MPPSETPLPPCASVLTPRLFCRDVAAEVEFCKSALAARELNLRRGPDGSALHALLTISDAMLMIEAEFPALPNRAPTPDGTSPVAIYAYVPNVDETVQRALNAGAKLLIPAKDQFWGDRTAWIIDPAGHVWTLATRIEQTTADQRSQRWEDLKLSS